MCQGIGGSWVRRVCPGAGMEVWVAGWVAGLVAMAAMGAGSYPVAPGGLGMVGWGASEAEGLEVEDVEGAVVVVRSTAASR